MLAEQLADLYLERAGQTLSAMANAERLYGPQRNSRGTDDMDDAPSMSLQDDMDRYARSMLLQKGAQERAMLGRVAILLTAFAAEAYINEFLASFLSGSELKEIDKFSTITKYVLGTRLVLGHVLFEPGHLP